MKPHRELMKAIQFLHDTLYGSPSALARRRELLRLLMGCERVGPANGVYRRAGERLMRTRDHVMAIY